MAEILVAGIYLAHKPNTAAHIMLECAASNHHQVHQRWIALAPDGQGSYDLPLTELVVTEKTPKFTLLNRLLEDHRNFDWIMLTDDDVELAPDFLDTMTELADRHDFALCQPARTADSFIDHPITQIMPGLSARRTRFVEIGPVTLIRHDAAELLLPFPEACGMGWGLDFVWPVVLERQGLRLGIIDAAPVAHRLRRPVSEYVHADADRQMFDLLAQAPHLSHDAAFMVLEAHA